MANFLVNHDDAGPSTSDTALINFLTGRGHSVTTAIETSALPNSGYDACIVTNSGAVNSAAMLSVEACSLPVVVLNIGMFNAALAATNPTGSGSSTTLDLQGNPFGLNTGYPDPLTHQSTAQATYGIGTGSLPTGATLVAILPSSTVATAWILNTGDSNAGDNSSVNRRVALPLPSAGTQLTELLVASPANDWFEGILEWAATGHDLSDPGYGHILLEDGSGSYEMEGTTDDYLLDTTDPGGAATGSASLSLSGTGVQSSVGTASLSLTARTNSNALRDSAIQTASFESTVEGFVAGTGSPTIGRSSSDAHSGTWSLSMTTTTISTSVALQTASWATVDDVHDYGVGVWYRQLSGVALAPLTMTAFFYNGSTLLNTYSVVQAISTSWQYLSTDAIAMATPVGTTNIRVGFSTSGASGSVLLFDELTAYYSKNVVAASVTGTASLGLSGVGVHSSVGSASIALSGSGPARVTAAGTASLSLSATSAARAPASATAALSLSGSNSAPAIVFSDDFENSTSFVPTFSTFSYVSGVSGQALRTTLTASSSQLVVNSNSWAAGTYRFSFWYRVVTGTPFTSMTANVNGDIPVNDEVVAGSGWTYFQSSLLVIDGAFPVDFYLDISGTIGDQVDIDVFRATKLSVAAAVVGSGLLTLSGAGVHSSVATASLSLSGTGVQSSVATASLSLSATGAATVGGVAASGTASLSLTAVGVHSSVASASIAMTGAGAARAPTSGTASLGLSGAGVQSSVGTASLSLSGAGAARGAATASASLSLSGAGAGRASATSSATLSLSASGTPATSVVGSATLALSGVGAAGVGRDGTASLSLSGTGAVSALVSASASLSLSAVGEAHGPLAPTGLTVTPISNVELLIDWDDYVGALAYEIERDGSFLVRTSVSTYSDTGLTPSTQYCYRVRAML